MVELLYNGWFMFGLFVVALVIGTAWGMKKNKSTKKGGENEMRLNSVTALAVLMAVLFTLPVLSIDIEGIFTYAFDIVNAFMPLIAIVAGLGLGFNLVSKIGGLFRNAL